MPGLTGPLAAPKSGPPPTREVIDLTLDDDMDVDEVQNHRPVETTTQPNRVAPIVKKEPGEQVTFVSTINRRAQSQSPQKQKQINVTSNILKPRSASSNYHHSPHDIGDNERSFRVVSATIPQKRKSQSAEASEVNDSSDEVSLPIVSQNGIPDTAGSSSSLKATGKRPAITPKTPSPPPGLGPTDSVSVVIPSPSAAQRQQLKASLQPEFIGISERYFPTGREEKIKAQRRAYPIATAAKVNKKALPFTITKRPTDSEPTKPIAPLSISRSVFPSTASALHEATEPMTQASTAKFLRKKLRKKLKRICGGPETVFEVNEEQMATLSANFFFVGDYRLGPGVTPIDDDFITGCDCGPVCDPSTCRCLFEEMDSDELIVAYERLESGKIVLRKDFLDKNAMISECNSRCQCAGSDCWNHVVQRGRQVRLEVFDTGPRGLGLRCLEPLITGQFIDCYFGEVITKKDADAREAANEGKPSYLFNLDWLVDNGHHTYEEIYVVDGHKFGTPTRYINHSCNPNCKIIPVSTNRLSDQKIYYLAFFAIRDIPARTELTFDYHPKWESMDLDPDAVKCLCGEKNCRGQLWPNTRKKGNN